MTAEEWAVVKEIAAQALALPADARDDYVRTRCAGVDSRHLEVQSLLDSVMKATDLYETPTFATPAALRALLDGAAADPSIVGERIGPYQIISEIGRGGMGAAYLARRADAAFDKRVAIKLIKRGMDTDAIVRRFRNERQILADLDHPNIVRLLDGGSTHDGLPYFIMEYVDGVPIDAYCTRQQLSTAERLRLFVAVCGAVHHAHQHRIVHRDLKPSNVLVTAGAVPKLLDFGIAKLLDTSSESQTVDPTLVSRAMTPQYASPEQIRGEPLTPASDIYSLGILLHVLLTGTRPSRPGDKGGADHGLPPDLEAIVFTALEEDPQRRYPTVAALAEDIQRFLDGAPVTARRHAPVRLWTSRRIVLVAAAVLIGAALVIRDIQSVDSPAPVRSIAVLPLSNGSGDPGLDYVADGITEDVINRLSRAPRLKVIARDSAYRYKGKTVDPEQVGRALRVDSVLTGSVLQNGASLSVTAELMDVRGRSRLWSQRYDRRVGDLQLVQRELAQQIATNLRLQFTTAERAQFSRTYTDDADAYQLYLKGRYFWNKRTENGLHTSVSYFNQAIGRDPGFALAYSGLADSYGLLTEYHAVPAAETYENMRDAVTRALQADASLAEAHTSLAYLRQFYEWDWAGAEREFKRAIALNPNYATAYQWYAEYLTTAGRHAEALTEIRKAEALDPLSLIINAVEANLLYMAGEYDRAIDKSLEVIDMDPNFPEVYEYLKRAYDQKGLYKEAIAARQTRRRILGLDTTETSALRAAAAATTPQVYWENRLAQELLESRTEGFLAYELAELFAQAGQTPRALDWLERACAGDDFMTAYMRVAPNLKPLRNEPRFLALVRGTCRVQARSAPGREVTARP